jgi:tetratricopeptide (TPR) repeat protein
MQAQSQHGPRTMGGRLLVVLLSLLLPLAALADDKEAGRLFAAGQEAADKGDYLTALRAFEDSLKAKPHPYTLFSMAQAQRKQFLVDRDIARAHRAIALYQEFVRQMPASPWRKSAETFVLDLLAVLARDPQAAPRENAPPPPPPATQIMVTSTTPGARIFIGAEDRGERSPAIRVVDPGNHGVRVEAKGYRTATREVRALKERLVVSEVNLDLLPGRVRVLASEDGARVYIDGQPVGQTPFEAGGFAAGEHAIAISSRGRRLWTGAIKVEPDSTALAVANLSWSRQRKIAAGTALGSGAVFVAGMVTGLVALKSDASLGPLTSKTNTDREDFNSRLQGRDRMATASTVLISLAGAALLAAAGIYWFDTPEAPAARFPDGRPPGSSTTAFAHPGTAP